MDRTVDVTTARQRLGTLLDEVYYKKENIIIERKGKALARLTPVNSLEAREMNIKAPKQERSRLLTELNSLPIISMDKEPTEVLRKVRAEKASRAKDLYG